MKNPPLKQLVKNLILRELWASWKSRRLAVRSSLGDGNLIEGARQTDKLDAWAFHKSNHLELLRSLPRDSSARRRRRGGKGSGRKIDSAEFSTLQLWNFSKNKSSYNGNSFVFIACCFFYPSEGGKMKIRQTAHNLLPTERAFGGELRRFSILIPFL